MRKYLLALIIFFLIISTSCGRKDANLHNNITFINNSSFSLFVCGDWEYPDTSISFGNPLLAGDFHKVNANSSGDPLKVRYSLESMFKSVDKLMVFVFDSNILEINPWDSVKSKYLVLKRYDLNLEDLENKDWTINYP